MTDQDAPSPIRPKPDRLTAFAVIQDRRNWPTWLIVVACIVVFGVQMMPPDQLEAGFFSAQALHAGRWWTVFTAVFMHGSALHLLCNMAAYLVLAPLVAARFGRGWRGILSYYAFFLFCGLAGNLTFWLTHQHDVSPVAGASGAIYGIYAAGMRLASDRLYPLRSRRTALALWFFVWSNPLIILLYNGVEWGLHGLNGQGANVAIPIAWEAHLGGFVAGFFLIQLMAGRGWKDDGKPGIVIPIRGL